MNLSNMMRECTVQVKYICTTLSGKNGLIEGSWEYSGKQKVKYYEITDECKNVLFKLKKLAKQDYKNYYNIYTEFKGIYDI